MRLFDTHYHIPGTAPGTLHQPRSDVPFSIHLLDCGEHGLEELYVAEPSLCRPFLEQDSVTWIHCRGGAPVDDLKAFGSLLDLHPLALEDVASSGQRAKVDEYDKQLFVVLHLPVLFPDGGVDGEQICFFVGVGYLLSFQVGASDPFGPVRERLRRGVGRIPTRGSGFLLYALLDAIVDQGFPLLDAYGERIEAIEEALLGGPDRGTLEQIHALRRELLLLRRMLWPARDVLARLTHEPCDCIRPETQLYLRDCLDHQVRILDLLETYREMTGAMLEVYLSSVGNRQNESMRLLTMISTVFIPMSFVAGVYGMNFGSPGNPLAMPELRWTYGYPAILLLMASIAALMLWLFWRKKL